MLMSFASPGPSIKNPALGTGRGGTGKHFSVLLRHHLWSEHISLKCRSMCQYSRPYKQIPGWKWTQQTMLMPFTSCPAFLVPPGIVLVRNPFSTKDSNCTAESA